MAQTIYCLFAQNGQIQLDTTQAHIQSRLRRILDGWWTVTPSQTNISLVSEWYQVDLLPSPPNGPPDFVDSRFDTAGATIGGLSVYQISVQKFVLYWQHGAYVEIDLHKSPFHLSGFIASSFIDNPSLEDVFFTSLAAPLRRLGIYLLHAFAANVSTDQKCAVLLVGAMQSGKTTTGLNMLFHGWRLLANDVVALQAIDGEIYAFPTPNLIGIRPQTFQLLTKLKPLLNGNHSPPKAGLSYTGHDFVRGRWGECAPIKQIFAPIISDQSHTIITPLSPSICASLLLQESLDVWDITAVGDHTKFLTTLATQGKASALVLGHNIKKIPEQIMAYVET